MSSLTIEANVLELRKLLKASRNWDREPLRYRVTCRTKPKWPQLMAVVHQAFHHLDVLVLNASGGLEKDKAEDYAMTLNHAAQLYAAEMAASIMSQGGRIVFVTSPWAPFYGKHPV